MLTPYESRLGLVWLANAAGRIHHRRPEAVALAEWVNEHIEALAASLAGQGCGIDAAGLAEAAAKCQEAEMPRNRVASKAWREPARGATQGQRRHASHQGRPHGVAAAAAGADCPP